MIIPPYNYLLISLQIPRRASEGFVYRKDREQECDKQDNAE